MIYGEQQWNHKWKINRYLWNTLYFSICGLLTRFTCISHVSSFRSHSYLDVGVCFDVMDDCLIDRFISDRSDWSNCPQFNSMHWKCDFCWRRRRGKKRCGQVIICKGLPRMDRRRRSQLLTHCVTVTPPSLSLHNHQLMEVHLFLPFNPQFDA